MPNKELNPFKKRLTLLIAWTRSLKISIDAILAASITLIRTFEKQIKDLDKAIERIMKGVPQNLQTIPEIGYILLV